jgi:uncharacterized membrane protein YccC
MRSRADVIRAGLILLAIIAAGVVLLSNVSTGWDLLVLGVLLLTVFGAATSLNDRRYTTEKRTFINTTKPGGPGRRN